MGESFIREFIESAPELTNAIVLCQRQKGKLVIGVPALLIAERVAA